MRIGCLQFAPQVGDIDQNLNRADAVLNKAKPRDLEDLDLLVLPELAFTGIHHSVLSWCRGYCSLNCSSSSSFLHINSIRVLLVVLREIALFERKRY